MTNILYYNNFYRYRESRKQIKNIVDTANFVEAKTRLDELIAEHELNYPTLKRDFNYGERIMMEHAQRHLEAVIDQNDPTFGLTSPDDITTSIGTGKHSDKVKEALLQNPKSEY